MKTTIDDKLYHTRKIVIKWHNDDMEENTLYYPIDRVNGNWIATKNGKSITVLDHEDSRKAILRNYELYTRGYMFAVERLHEERCRVLTCIADIEDGYGEELTEEDIKYIAQAILA